MFKGIQGEEEGYEEEMENEDIVVGVRAVVERFVKVPVDINVKGHLEDFEL